MRDLFSRAAWGLLLVAVGVCAAGVQMDRAARSSVTVARNVPAFFRGFALETLARDAYSDGDDVRGLAVARELVTRRPVPAEGLALYANGLIATGQADAALQPVVLAAQRGWHDRFTQRIVISLAVGQQDWRVAAQRLLALWRLNYENDEDVLDLSRAALASPQTVASFADGIRPGEAWWIGRFLLWSADSLPPDSVARLGAAARTHRAEYNCSSLSSGGQALLVSGKPEAVQALWRETCGSAGMTALADLTLKSQTVPGPFDWSFPDDAGLTSELEEGHGGPVLRYQNTDHVRTVVASRFLALEPGSWQVSVNRGEADGVNGKALKVRLRCGSRILQFSDGRYVADGEAARILVPERCAAQQIEVLTSRGSGVLKSVVITR